MAVIRTPLGRARGLGASKHGVGHFISQRVTAVALVALTLWGAAAAISLENGSYQSAAQWLESPVNAALAILLVVAGFWHMQLGVRTIIEDYFQTPFAKGVLLVANLFVCWLGGAVGVLSILKVAVSGGSTVV
jgi:succinate dehydrogenase / fumarate reductase membrane anchor subunit